jgi:hypothetical protein
MGTVNQFLRESGVNLNERGFEFPIPQKIFIENDGPQREYSEYEPSGMKSKIDNLLNGVYASNNFIELFYSIPEVFAPVHEIASRVADANWQLKKNSDDEVIFNNADFNRLFSQPNPLMAMRQFVYQAVCYEILTGKELFYFNKVNVFGEKAKNIVNWWNLPAPKIVATHKDDFDPYFATHLSDFIKNWKIPSYNKQKPDKTFEPDSVLPLLNFDLNQPFNFNTTVSFLKGAEKAIRNLIPVYEARGVIYIKRGALGFLVSKKSDESGMISLTKKEKAEAQTDFNSSYGLTAGKETIGVTSVPLEFIRTSMSIQELQPFDETAADAAAIYATLRVPAHLQPSKDKSTFNNADTDLKSFYTDVIIPWAKKYAQLWTPYFEFSRGYIEPDYSHISVLQINRKEKSAVDKIQGSIWTERWLNSACSLNEWILANEGFPGTGSLYEKKLLDLTPEELLKVGEIMNLKSKSNDNDESTKQPKVEKEAKGTETESRT